MPLSPQFLAKFEAEQYFHVICKTVENKKLFFSDENRQYFLKRYLEFCNDIVETYAWALLNNHAHFLVRCNSEATLRKFFNKCDDTQLTKTQKRFLNNECDLHELVEQQFHRLFIAYTLSFNKVYNVHGHLFQRPFRRLKITDDAHLSQLIIYIHANAQKHQLVKDFRTFRWSSYHSILSARPTEIKRNEVLEWFGGTKRFTEIHMSSASEYYRHALSGED